MKNILDYLKYIGLFMIFVIIFSLIVAFINMMGINSKIIAKIAVILTASSFFIVSALASNKKKEKGYIIGLKLSIMTVILLLLINVIIFKSEFTGERIIYYAILILSSILGGSFGKNIKIN